MHNEDSAILTGLVIGWTAACLAVAGYHHITDYKGDQQRKGAEELVENTTCDTFEHKNVVSCVDGRNGDIVGEFYITPNSNISCQEDEILTVYIDHNPEHELSWHCVNAEQFLNEER